MPSTYAHLHFGNNAKALLPKDVFSAVQAYPQLYDIGLHGPDILFYYKPLKACKINQIGYDMHSKPAKKFFFNAKNIYNEKNERKPMLSYLAGFVCHYALDSMCHSYVEKKLTVSNLTHTEIESEFDRYLIQKDGKDILHMNFTDHIFASDYNAHIISEFFSDISDTQIKTALRSMKFYNSFLSSHGICRHIVNAVLKLSGNYTEIHGMMIAENPLDESEDSNLRLEKLLNRALVLYEKMMKDYYDFLNGGAQPQCFEDTFGPQDGWENIPVLPPEEEKAYEI